MKFISANLLATIPDPSHSPPSVGFMRRETGSGASLRVGRMPALGVKGHPAVQVPVPNPCACGQDCSDCAFRLNQSVAEGPAPRSVRCTTTTSLSKTKVVHPNRGDVGNFTRLGRADRCSNLNFLKPCPKLPERARRHWRKSGPSERLDCCYWPASPTSDRPPCASVFNSTSVVLPVRWRGLSSDDPTETRSVQKAAAGNVDVLNSVRRGTNSRQRRAPVDEPSQPAGWC